MIVRLKNKGLRMGQTPGAEAEDGGQSMLARHGEYTPSSPEYQPPKKEDAMKFADFLRGTVDFIGFAVGLISMIWFGLAIAVMLE